ncbi:MAG: AhpD family alkylhydroperoxidase [Porticoccaceae bacterium]|jgi:AhpD family alkylhydroperoxidase|tara:strand:- start:1321 stop:1872 length:552 start_codon:yes stop_codon:yes gene_type:complete
MKQFTFPLKDKSDLTEPMQKAFDRSVSRRGEAKLISAMGHAPDLFDWYVDDFYQKLFYQGSAPTKYKELGRLRLSQVHGCRSCNKGNRLDAEAAGLSSGKIAAIGDIESNVFNAADKAVIQLADLMSLHANGGRLSQSLYDDLRVHFNDGEILELSLVFSFLAGMAHFLFAFDMVEREDSCQF